VFAAPAVGPAGPRGKVHLPFGFSRIQNGGCKIIRTDSYTADTAVKRHPPVRVGFPIAVPEITALFFKPDYPRIPVMVMPSTKRRWKIM
jgi:hypothetical protein